MLALLRLAAGVASRSAAARAGDSLRQMMITFIAGLLALVGLGFLTSAGWIALSHTLGPIAASLIAGAAFLLLALVLLLVAGRPRRSTLDTEAEALKAQVQALAGRLPDEIAKSPALPLMGAFIGGLILAVRLRR